MSFFDRTIEALVFLSIGFFTGYGFFTFFQAIDTITGVVAPVLNKIAGIAFGITTLLILIILRRMSQ